MIGKVLIALLLCCAICFGQSTMTFPGGPQQPAQADTDSDTSAQSCRAAEDQGYEPQQCPITNKGEDSRREQASPRNSADKEKLEDETRPSESTRNPAPSPLGPNLKGLPKMESGTHSRSTAESFLTRFLRPLHRPITFRFRPITRSVRAISCSYEPGEKSTSTPGSQ